MGEQHEWSCGRAAAGLAVDVRSTFLDGMANHLEADIKFLQRCQDEVRRWTSTSVGQGAGSAQDGKHRGTRTAVAEDGLEPGAGTATCKPWKLDGARANARHVAPKRAAAR